MLLPRSTIPLDEVTGLEPQTWISVGTGYSREEIKELLLAAGRGGIVASAVTNPAEIAAGICGGIELLGPISRQEALRRLLADRRVSARLPELKRMRRQAGFFRKLDEAVQAGRTAAATPEELEIFDERLRERFGPHPLRAEIRVVEALWQAWLEAADAWDGPRAIRRATALVAGLVEEGAARERVLRGLPARFLVLSTAEPEGLEVAFWEAIGRECEIHRPLLETPALSAPRALGWEAWHTGDDAAERLAVAVAERPEDHVVLIPDLASVRRSLKRALARYGIPEADTRDPNRLHQDEAVKWALLPLELVARDFPRELVQAWLSTPWSLALGEAGEPASRGELPTEPPRWAGLQGMILTRPTMITEINARGIRQGLASYRGGMLEPLAAALAELAQRFGGRRTLAELQAAHLAWLRERAIQAPATESVVVSLLPVMDAAWRAFSEDLVRVGEADRVAPLLYWFERFEERLLQTPSPVAKSKPAKGLRALRLQQIPLDGLAPPRHLWILGLPPHWLSAEGIGDPWFSERDRESLAAEFPVRAGTHARRERLAALRAWILPVLEAGGQVTILDPSYDPDGRERESSGALLREVLQGTGALLPDEPVAHGAHDRWRASFGSQRPLQPQHVELDPLHALSEELPEVTATAVDFYSRCPFQALAFARWRVRDVREPDTELWPDVRGNLLHDAVRLLLRSRDADGAFQLSPLAALEQAWRARPPKGLIRSARLETYLRGRLLRVLETFCAEERDYFGRAGARILHLDDREFRLRMPGVIVRGKPDRVDETDEGLFIMDYKTSSQLPTGRAMLEQGVRLQLPFYALAAAAELGRKVLGVQFIKLTRDGGRGSGVFFPAYNGPETGKLTVLTKRSHSLLGQPSEDEIWTRLQAHVEGEATGLARGVHPARPKDPAKECPRCDARDLCGYGRRVSEGLVEAEEIGADGGAW